MKKILVEGSVLIESDKKINITEGSVLLEPHEFEAYERAKETCFRLDELANKSKGGASK